MGKVNYLKNFCTNLSQNLKRKLPFIKKNLKDEIIGKSPYMCVMMVFGCIWVRDDDVWCFDIVQLR